MIASFFSFLVCNVFFNSIRLIRKEYKLITLHMRTRMMALFALIAFCVMPNRGEESKREWGYYHERNLRQRLFSDKKSAQPPWDIATVGSAYSAVGGNPSYVFGYTQGESASLRITIDENLYPYINVQVKNEELSISTENGTQLSPTRFKIEGTSKKLGKNPDVRLYGFCPEKRFIRR